MCVCLCVLVCGGGGGRWEREECETDAYMVEQRSASAGCGSVVLCKKRR